jgi:MraZ protein
MLLTGTHPRTLDDKNRLTLPKRIREQIGDVATLYVMQGQDQCLWLYTPAELERLAEKIDRAPATDVEVRVFRRLFFANMEAADVDANGRILLPDRLMQFASLKRDVVLLGNRDHLELWDSDHWQRYTTENAPRFDAAAEGAFRK